MARRRGLLYVTCSCIVNQPSMTWLIISVPRTYVNICSWRPINNQMVRTLFNKREIIASFWTTACVYIIMWYNKLHAYLIGLCNVTYIISNIFNSTIVMFSVMFAIELVSVVDKNCGWYLLPAKNVSRGYYTFTITLTLEFGVIETPFPQIWTNCCEDWSK